MLLNKWICILFILVYGAFSQQQIIKPYYQNFAIEYLDDNEISSKTIRPKRYGILLMYYINLFYKFSNNKK